MKVVLFVILRTIIDKSKNIRKNFCNMQASSNFIRKNLSLAKSRLNFSKAAYEKNKRQ